LEPVERGLLHVANLSVPVRALTLADCCSFSAQYAQQKVSACEHQLSALQEEMLAAQRNIEEVGKSMKEQKKPMAAASKSRAAAEEDHEAKQVSIGQSHGPLVQGLCYGMSVPRRLA